MIDKVIFFAPHASIWVHSFPELLVAKSLVNQGYRVTVVGCHGILAQRCTTFDAMGIRGTISSETKNNVCGQCIKSQKRLDKRFKFERLWIDDFLTAADIKDVDSEIDISTSLLRLKYRNIPIGQLATYETLLTFKKINFDFNREQFQEYRSYLRGCLLAIQAFNKIFDNQEPSFLFTYNSAYSINRSISLLAQNRGIQAYSLHGGSHHIHRYSTLIVAKDNQILHGRYLLSIWPNFSNIPVSSRTASIITSHLIEVFRGCNPWAYSTSPSKTFDTRIKFNIQPHQRILLATMSSHDERFAAETIGLGIETSQVIFASQIEWITWLFEYTRVRSDIFLIVRVHPRDFPNKREKVLSDFSKKLLRKLENPPKNVAINWPTDNISLYDLAIDVDIVLNAWSSVGKELSMLGIPVITYAPELLTYPLDFLIFMGDSIDTYTRAIETAMSTGWSFERIRTVYRWLALEQVYSVLDISDCFNPERKEQFKFVQRLLSRVQWLNPDSLVYGNLVDDLLKNRKYSIADVNPIPDSSMSEEKKVLAVELNRLATALELSNRPHSSLGRAVQNFFEAQL